MTIEVIDQTVASKVIKIKKEDKKMWGITRRIIIDSAGSLSGFPTHQLDMILRTQMEKEIEGHHVIVVDGRSSSALNDYLVGLGCTIKENHTDLNLYKFNRGDLLYWILGQKVLRHSFK